MYYRDAEIDSHAIHKDQEAETANLVKVTGNRTIGRPDLELFFP